MSMECSKRFFMFSRKLEGIDEIVTLGSDSPVLSMFIDLMILLNQIIPELKP